MLHARGMVDTLGWMANTTSRWRSEPVRSPRVQMHFLLDASQSPQVRAFAHQRVHFASHPGQFPHEGSAYKPGRPRHEESLVQKIHAAPSASVARTTVEVRSFKFQPLVLSWAGQGMRSIVSPNACPVRQHQPTPAHEDVAVIKEPAPQPGHAINLHAMERGGNSEPHR